MNDISYLNENEMLKNQYFRIDVTFEMRTVLSGIFLFINN
jgi:hypothetical protein